MTPAVTPDIDQMPEDEKVLAHLGLHPLQVAIAQHIASGGAPQPMQQGDASMEAQAPDPSMAPAIARPQSGARPINVPSAPSEAALPSSSPMSAAPQMSGVTPAAPTHRTELEAKQQQLDKGSGIAQFQQRHPVIGGIARVAAGIGSAMFPGIAMAIPGTDLHHQVLENENARELKGLDESEQSQAQTRNLDAQPELKQAALAQGQTKIEQGQQKIDETGDRNQHAYSTKLRQLGLELGPDGQPTALSYENMSPTEQAVHDLKTNQADAAEAKAELAQMQANPNSPMYQMQLKRLQVAQQNASNAAKRLNLSSEQFQNKLQEQELIKPSGQAQSRGSSAQAALDIMPDLEKEIRSNAANLGPIMGRLQSGEIKIGDVDPKIAHLYSSLNSFYALNPSIHGFRNYELVKDMPSIIGGLSRDPEATIAGLEGLKSTIQSVAKEGKTFHNRVVEGRDTPKTSTGPGAGGGKQAPAAGTVEGGYKFKGGDPADQKNWEKAP